MGGQVAGDGWAPLLPPGMRQEGPLQDLEFHWGVQGGGRLLGWQGKQQQPLL